jgi:hypothetical protein
MKGLTKYKHTQFWTLHFRCCTQREHGPLSTSSAYPTHSLRPRPAHSHLEYANTRAAVLLVLTGQTRQSGSTAVRPTDCTTRRSHEQEALNRTGRPPTVLQSTCRGGKQLQLPFLKTKKVKVLLNPMLSGFRKSIAFRLPRLRMIVFLVRVLLR